MKHVVIYSSGDGDEFRAIAIKNEAIEAIQLARRNASEVVKDFWKDMNAGLPEGEKTDKPGVKEDFWTGANSGDYEFTIDVKELGFSWTVHPIDC